MRKGFKFHDSPEKKAARSAAAREGHRRRRAGETYVLLDPETDRRRREVMRLQRLRWWRSRPPEELEAFQRRGTAAAREAMMALTPEERIAWATKASRSAAAKAAAKRARADPELVLVDVRLVFYPYQLEALTRAAAAAGMTRSRFVRERLDRLLEDDDEETG